MNTPAEVDVGDSTGGSAHVVPSAAVPEGGVAPVPTVIVGWAVRGAVLAAAVGVWWGATRGLNPDHPVLGKLGPGDALASLAEQLGHSKLWEHIGTSLRRLGLGLGLAIFAGVPLGVVFGMHRLVERATAPLVQFLRMVSPLSWAPVAVAVLGVGDAPVTFLIAAAAVWPVALGASAGVRGLDQGWLRVAQSLGATRCEQYRRIVLPGIRQPVLTAARVALGIGWVVLVPAEMLGVGSGLGYAVLNARDNLAYDDLAAMMLLIGLLGFTLDGACQWLLRQRRADRRSLVAASPKVFKL